ncbi:hypothetical protein V6N11_006869 [Hibiscus sabdariffa]|uniref:Uncharacterized protein n=1 Tax=Hibiscus sabdariffa TaxID=183260 RepID=A0ABR2RS40_9ROSI
MFDPLENELPATVHGIRLIILKRTDDWVNFSGIRKVIRRLTYTLALHVPPANAPAICRQIKDLGRENVKESHNLQTRPRPYCEVQEAFVKRQSLSEVVVEAYLNRYDIVIPVEWSSMVFDNLEIKGILNLPNKNGILCLRCSDEFPGA